MGGAVGGPVGSVRRAAATALIAFAAAGCSLLRPAAPPPIEDGVQTGVASWYGPGFHGRQTASGEIYDQHALTAAHPSLPFGTQVRVTNLDNGRTVEVRITDRGPFVGGRAIDLSYGAARVIGMIGPGVAPVRLEVLPTLAAVARAAPERAAVVLPVAARAAIPEETPAYLVQVAVLRDPALADRLRQVLASRFPDTRVDAAAGDGGYHVRLGPFRGEREARAQAERVVRLGYPAALVEEGP